MARVGNTSNLEDGSKYDLLIFEFPEGYPIGAIDIGFGKTPHRISGVQKVSQVFLKTLASPKGTDVLYSGRGTEFGSISSSYNLQAADSSELESIVRASVISAETQTKSILNINTAGLASQLESATLIGITTVDDGVSVQIKLLTKAGEAAPIALPFTSLGIEVNE